MDAKLDLRVKQFSLLMNTIQNLKATLDEDAEMEDAEAEDAERQNHADAEDEDMEDSGAAKLSSQEADDEGERAAFRVATVPVVVLLP